jgi:hypothetical protein
MAAPKQQFGFVAWSPQTPTPQSGQGAPEPPVYPTYSPYTEGNTSPYISRGSDEDEEEDNEFPLVIPPPAPRQTLSAPLLRRAPPTGRKRSTNQNPPLPAVPRKRRRVNLTVDDIEVLFRLCNRDAEAFRGGERTKFWNNIRKDLKKETGKEHSNLQRVTKQEVDKRRAFLEEIGSRGQEGERSDLQIQIDF